MGGSGGGGGGSIGGPPGAPGGGFLEKFSTEKMNRYQSHTNQVQTLLQDHTWISCTRDIRFHCDGRYIRISSLCENKETYCCRALLSSLNFPTSPRSIRTSEAKALLNSSRYCNACNEIRICTSRDITLPLERYMGSARWLFLVQR